MAHYVVTLSHTEVISVEADTGSEAVHKAYAQAEVNCFWHEVDVEELEDEEEEADG